MSVADLVSALDGLQSNAAERQKYNLWLQEFQRSPEAWQVVYEILGSEAYPRGVKIFCAQTLRNKIALDLHQVPKDARMHLKDQVLVLLAQNAELLAVVGVQLCIALAAFAMQVAEWESPIQELMSKFNSTEMIPLLFEFLRVLPEEFQSDRAGLVEPELRLQRSTKLVQESAPLVLNFMLSQANIMSQDGDRQILFFEALKPWLNEVDLADIVASPLIGWMFASLRTEESRSAAVDCLILILKECSEIHEGTVLAAISALFPPLVQAAAESKPHYDENPELHRDMTRLLSEAGLSWHALVARNPEQFIPILTAIVDCITVDSPDLEVIEFTFDFFDKLRTMLGEPLPGSSAPLSQPIDRTPFQSTFLTLFVAFIKLLQFPSSFNNNLEEEEIFREFRYDIGDMLKVCSAIAGHEQALKLCCEMLQGAQDMGSWQPLEAVLFSIRAIARTVPTSERKWLPVLYSLLPSLPFSSNELVQHALLMLLGRYSQWSSNNPQYLEFELTFITHSMFSSSSETRRAAAHAFLYLCTDAAKQLLPFLSQLFEFYNSLTGSVDVESMCKCADGLGAVLNQLFESGRTEELTRSLEMLFAPVMARAAALTGGEYSAEKARAVAYDIQGLGSLLATINANPGVEAVITANCAGLISLLVTLGPKSDVLLSSISRFFIHAVFNASKAVESEKISLFSAVLLVANSKSPVNSVLFELGSAVVQNFTACAEVWQFSTAMCQILFSSSTMDMMKEQGEIVDYETDVTLLLHHGIHFLCDLGVYYSKLYFESLFEPSNILAVEAINLCWDSDVLSSVGHFYDDVESFMPANTVEDSTKEDQSDIRDNIVAVMEKTGFSLIRALFYWFLLKRDPLGEATVERIVDFAFRVCPVSSVTWLQHILHDLPVGTASDEEKMTFAGQVFKLMSSNRFRGIGREMNVFVRAYSARNFSAR